ncbi:putative fatty acyl-CoA reductase CG5065 [Penaeus chinensis]|uniref:putative fatty acyl-CoA reductase CG5065 n=1 Tax=Penaeus chinensis TaxID=139456 RepID=UPI001FB5CDA5|nr:putative fatty acyl-CoA reductase CG5065 [Penaeus chinensis]
MSTVADFYRDRSVLITGATGFMGKVLVEKLLRSCPGLSKIYLLMRPKGGHHVDARLDELLNSKLFDQLRSSCPEVLDKLVAVQGDITLPGLGISPADSATLASHISVVFHAAATVKFDEALKLSLQMNVLGTRRLVELCHKMEKLVALVHVSTAYCNCDRVEVKEVVYPPPIDPYKLIQLVDWMDDDTFNHLTPKLIGSRPNTYTYTKALAEHVLVQEAGSLPLAIVRPSIVAAAWREPLPGWVDNLNGPTGLIVGAGKGMLRTLHCRGELVADLIPVDIPINLLIVTAWHTATQRMKEIVVYNCVSGIERPVRWGEINEHGMIALRRNAMNDVVWYPDLRFTQHKTLNTIAVLLQHWLPAYLMDAAARLAGKRPIMVRIAQKLDRAASCLEYFTTHEWRFCNENVQGLWESLSETDQKTFNFALSALHWPTYMEQYCLGTKRYVMKEELSTLPTARKHLSKMWWIQQAWRVLVVVVAWRLVMLRSPAARRAWYGLFRLLVRLLTHLPILNRI